MVEQWKAVPAHAGYEVSDFGRVRSVDRVAVKRSSLGNEYRIVLRGRLLRPFRMKHGYRGVALGARSKHSVHRLVLLAFVGACPEAAEAMHLDNDPANNALTNLRYGTHTENMRHIAASGRRPLTPERVRRIRRLLAEGITQLRVARRVRASPYQVCRVAAGTSYAHIR